MTNISPGDIIIIVVRGKPNPTREKVASTGMYKTPRTTLQAKGGGKMDANAIIQLVSNVGFPIACTVAMFMLFYKEREAHSEESKKFVEAIDNNTRIMEEVKNIVQTLGK